MIDAIEINNFRCFHQTKISGFKSINLIGGKNNSGKTALLEAIHLANNPSTGNIHSLQEKRGENGFHPNPKEAFKTLFYQQETMNPVSLTIKNNVNNFQTKIEQVDNSTESIITLFSYKDSIEQYHSSIRVGTNSITRNEDNIFKVYSVEFITSQDKPSDESLAKTYQLAKYDNQAKIILDAFKLIDNSISDVDTFSFSGAKLYLVRTNEKYMPLGMFGDAMSKIANIILKIVNTNNSIILIDEIENGLHFTAHEDFWKMLFKLAKAYNVQIFATSHSLEMISAFNKVAYQTEFEQDAMYFEMSRHVKTQEIIANPMDMQMLHYEIIKNNTFRGE